MERSDLSLTELEILRSFCEHKMKSNKYDNEYDREHYRKLLNQRIDIETRIEAKLNQEFPTKNKI